MLFPPQKDQQSQLAVACMRLASLQHRYLRQNLNQFHFNHLQNAKNILFPSVQSGYSRGHFSITPNTLSETPEISPLLFFFCLLCPAILALQRLTSLLAEVEEPNISPGVNVVQINYIFHLKMSLRQHKNQQVSQPKLLLTGERVHVVLNHIKLSAKQLPATNKYFLMTEDY